MVEYISSPISTKVWDQARINSWLLDLQSDSLLVALQGLVIHVYKPVYEGLRDVLKLSQ